MNHEELLYRYFSKKLTPEEEIVFNDLLQTNPDFKKQFDFEVDLKKVIRSEEDEKLKAKLQGFEEEISRKNKSSIFNYRNIAIAATIAILIGVIGFNNFFGANYDNLYQENFKTYPNTVYAITRSEGDNTPEREAFVAYETENYAVAIEKFNALTGTNKNLYINFYKAQAYLKLENFDEAKKLFEQVIEADTDFVAESYWYLSLIYLKQKDTDNAVKNLKILTENYSYNKEKANYLITELN